MVTSHSLIMNVLHHIHKKCLHHLFLRNTWDNPNEHLFYHVCATLNNSSFFSFKNEICIFRFSLTYYGLYFFLAAPDVNPSTENMQASIECTDSSHSVNPTQFNQNDVKIDIMEEHLDDQTKEVLNAL